MPKFLTAGAQKLIENFIVSTGCKGAIYDEEMTCIWSNYNEFFDTFDLKKQKGETPLVSDSSFSLELEGGRAVLNVTPIYKGPRTIAAYVCVIREAYDIFKMMNKSVISDFTDNIMRKSRDRLEKLTELNLAIGEAAMALESLNELGKSEERANEFGKLSELVEKQKQLLTSMNNETRFCIDTCFNEASDKDSSCNVTLLFSTACDYAAEIFKELGRRINIKEDDRDCYIMSEGSALLLGFLHLLRAHVILSPQGSAVSVTTSVESSANNTDYFCVKIKTLLLPREQTDKALLTTSRAYRELAKKVVMYNYGGEFKCADTNKNMLTVFKIPVSKKNRRAMLNSDKLTYGNIALTYLRDIVYREKNGES